jgi:hypothetical protein
MDNKYLVAPQEQAILDAQTSSCDMIYYNQDVSLRPKCPVVKNSRFVQNFASLNLPSSNTLQIPNLSIVDLIAYRLVLPQVPANVCLPRGWGYLLLNRLDVRIGSSTVLTFSKHQMLVDALSKCDTKEKQDYLLTLGGDEISAATSGTIEANCYLNAIISKIRQASAKLPLDLNLLNQPCQMTLYFDAVSTIAGGSAASTYGAAMSDASFHVVQMDFKNNMDSLKNEMILDPMASYNHFFNYRQDLAQQFTGSTNANQPVNLTLTGFRYGTLTSIGFVVVQNTSLNPVVASDPKNPFALERVSNIQLVFNGQVIARSNGWSHELVMLAERQLPPAVAYSKLSWDAVNSKFKSDPVNAYWYKIDFSQFSPEISEGHILSGINVSTNVFNLSFNTTTNNAYTIYLAYEFNSAIMISRGGAECDFVY